MSSPYRCIILIGFLLIGLAAPASGQSINTCEERLQRLERWFSDGAYLLVHAYTSDVDEHYWCTSQQSDQLRKLRILSAIYLSPLADAEIKLSTHSIDNPARHSGDYSVDYLLKENFILNDWKAIIDWVENQLYFTPSAMSDNELHLIHGYALFQQGYYQRAIAALSEVSRADAHFFYPAQYYSAMAYASLDDLDNCLRHLKVVEQYAYYQKDVPSFIGAIYYEKQMHQELIEHAKRYLTDPENNIQLMKLAGRSAATINDCQNAIAFFDSYISNSNRVESVDYYSLALCSYKLGNYNKASIHFEKIAHLDDTLGQLANHYIGGLLVDKDKKSARSAFRRASEMNFDSAISGQALFNFAKLSLEMRYDNEAFIAFRSIKPGAIHYSEAQKLMNSLLLTTSDIESALKFLNTITSKSEDLLTAEKQLCLQMGKKLLNEAKYSEALDFLRRSQAIDVPCGVTCAVDFWLAEGYYHLNQIELAKKHYKRFLNSETNDKLLMDQAHYSLGYIYFEALDYPTASQEFSRIEDSYLDPRIQGDVALRSGDCDLIRNEYDKARQHYERAINLLPMAEHDYPTFQLALIQGLKDNPVEKLVLLDKLIEQFPNSAYLDDALYESGVTLLSMDKPRDAIRSFQALIDEFDINSSLSIPSLLKIGLTSYNLGDVKTATEYYLLVLNERISNQEEEEALLALKEIYVNELTRPEEYLKILEERENRDVSLSEKDSLTYLAARGQYEKGNYARAIEAYDHYLVTYNDGLKADAAHADLAQCLLNIEEYSKALEHLIHCCQRSVPMQVDPCFAAGEIQRLSLGDCKEALTLYQQARTVDMTKEEVMRLDLGILRCADELDVDSLRIEYGKRTLSHSKLSEAEKAETHFYLGTAFMNQNNATLSIPHFNQVIKLTTNEYAAISRYNIAKTYYDSGEFELAEMICDVANRKNNSYPYWIIKGLILYSDILIELGENLNALAALDAALQHSGDYSELHEQASLKKEELISVLDQTNKLKN